MEFTHNVDIELLDSQFVKIIFHINENKFVVSDFEPLINLLFSDVSDSDFWSEIIVISETLTTEEPQSIPDIILPIIDDNTNITYTRSIAEKPAYDKNCASLTKALKIELVDNVYKSVGNFWNVYFETKRLSPITKRIWECYRDNNQCQPCVFHDNMEEAELRAWFHTFFARYLKQFRSPHEANTSERSFIRRSDDPIARGKFYHTTAFKQLQGGESKRKLDFFIADTEPGVDDIHHWRDIRVVGEFTKSLEQKGANFNQLTRYIREVFYAQPLRRFVHGFVVHKLHAEFWIVDRSGAYSSGKISLINNEADLVRAIAAYMFMSDEELGIDTTIYHKNGLSYITIQDCDEKVNREIEIVSEPIYRPETIVSRANICYRTTNDEYMIKFSWGSGAERSEIDYLKPAKSVNGVVTLVWYKELHKVETHREGLDFSVALRYFIKNDKWCLSHGVQKEGPTTPIYFRKRKLTLALLKPNGRPLQSCRSLREFLNGIRDAITGHHNLYTQAKVLHGDVSEGNIILTKPDENGKSEGILIDLDMSTSVDGKLEEEEEMKITGTVKYMAIELLRNMKDKNFSIKKSCRYDLESFFYVFLVGCLRYGRPNSNPVNLEAWSIDDVSENHKAKLKDIIDAFETNILDRFSLSFDAVKDLARDFRKILFGENLDQSVSMPNSVELYRPIIQAFNNVITQIDEGHIKNENLDSTAEKKPHRGIRSRGKSKVKSRITKSSRTKSRGGSALKSRMTK